MKKFFRIVSIVLFALLLFASLAACDNLGISSEELGNKDTFTYQVLSDSMNPVFKAGDIITLKRVEDASTLKVGDIICYYTVINEERVLNIHRIVNVYKSESEMLFETQGDNNALPDSLFVHEQDIVGVYLGSVGQSSSEELGDKDTFTYQVLSDSMNPVFKAGDIITLKRVEDASTLKVGDIICYYTIINGERVLNIHRIVNVYQGEGYRFFETKGDNNDMVDPLKVHEKDIVGVYCE